MIEFVLKTNCLVMFLVLGVDLNTPHTENTSERESTT